MEVWSRRQLDLAAVRQFPVQRDDLFEYFQVLVEDPVLVGLGKVAALFPQLAELLIGLKRQRVNPGEIEAGLQIAEIAFTKAPQRLPSGVSAGATAQQ